MTQTLKAATKGILILGLTLAFTAPPHSARAQVRVLYAFTGGDDGADPGGGLIADSAGNLYGTTAGGGSNNICGGSPGCGAVFRIAQGGTETVLYAFAGGADGEFPRAGLTADRHGSFYGTTSEGGSSDNGTVFKLAPDGKETVLYAFKGGNDGALPYAGLLRRGGNLYGTTARGGSQDIGTVFEIAPDGTETVLHTFTGKDGDTPFAGLIADKAGNLYGTTAYGGAGSCSCGTVFRVAPDGTETVLHSFVGSDGDDPMGGLLLDASGNLYGTTYYGGKSGCVTGCGVIFKLAPDGTETVLYNFCAQMDCSDGFYPNSSLVADRDGNLYGTTCECGDLPFGNVFKLAPDGTETVLGSFGGNDGSLPIGGLLKIKGRLYGTALFGSDGGCDESGCGTVFSVKR